MVNFSFTAEQNEMINEIRILAPILEEKSLELDASGDNDFDFVLVNLLAERNLLAPMISRKYNGKGFNYFTMALYMEEVGAICTGLASVIAAITHAASVIMIGGSKEQKEHFLPPLVKKKPKLAALALSEQAAGSDIVSMSTHATMKENQFILNGTKDYVINGSVADYVIVFATFDSSRGRSTMTSFIVPSNSEGLEIGCIRRKMGIRYAHTCELLLKNVALPAENMIGEPGSGYLLMMQTFDRGRALAGAASVGLARSAFEKALAFAKKREQFGKPIINNQAVGFEFAKMAAKIEAARLLVWKACWLIDNDEDYTMSSSIAKMAGSYVAQYTVARASDILGGRGYLEGHPLEKLYRDARILSTIEGTNHIQQAIVASLL